MYKSFTPEEYRKHFSLPDGYSVEGLLSFGGWMENKQRDEIKQSLTDSNIEYSTRTMDGFLERVLEIKINDKNYWFVVMYGGTMLSEYVHLASLFGSKKNIHIGSCGGLNPSLKSLDFIIPTWSYGNESITRIYDREAKDFKHYPDTNLTELLKKNIEANHSAFRGPIITNQAMMGETWEDITSWSEEGYYGVEMETSTIFSISKNFNVPSTAIVYVSDNLIKGQTVGDEEHFKQKKNREEIRKDMFTASLKTLLD